MRKHLILTIAVTSLLCSCNNRNDDIGWKPRNPEEDAKNEITSDPSSRFISKYVTMNYDDGGILVQAEDSRISFANLINGEEITLSWENSTYTDNPILNINGKPASIKSLEVLNECESGLWLRVITSDFDSISIVVTDISIP